MKRIYLNLVLVLAMITGSISAPIVAYAACPPSGAHSNSAKAQVLEGAGDAGTSCDGSETTKVFKVAVNILSFVAGIAAVIMIIISGFKYVTSGGDSGSVASAKTTLIYALIGIVVVALSQVIVKFVIEKAQV